MFSLVKNSKSTIIYFEDLIDVVTPTNKGGYNLFKTFVIDYLNIVKNERLNFISYEIEKYRLCRYFIYSWLVSLFITDKQKYSFETEGVFKILMKKYWYEPYIYPMLIVFWLKKIVKQNK
jgi:hypothetical protein